MKNTIPRRTWLYILLIVASLLIIGIIGLRATYQRCCTYTISYTVGGDTSTARIVYLPGDSLLGRATQAELQSALPWELHLVSDGYLHRRQASVQATSAPGTTLTCEVWINGHLAETHTGTASVGCAYDPERNPVP
jgi:hypothetical protein